MTIVLLSGLCNFNFKPVNAYVSFGVVISFSVEIAGVLTVFSTLVIPAVVAFLFTNRFNAALLIAWASGALAIVGGIGASFYWDVATGPFLVCAFGAVLIMAAIVCRLLGIRPDATIAVTNFEGAEWTYAERPDEERHSRDS